MAKMTWGIKHKAMATIYKGSILPLLSYVVRVWIEAMKYEDNRKKYIRVQRLINIRMSKAYRTTYSEAFCMLTAVTPIIIKLEEIVKRCKAKNRAENIKTEMDLEVEFKNWLHPADAVIIEVKSERGQNNSSLHRRKQAGPGGGIWISNF